MPNLLSDADIANIKSDIDDIVKDTSINTTIKYRQLSAVTQQYSVEQQDYAAIASIYSDWSGVSALKGLFRDEEVRDNPNLSAGDQKYVFMQSSVSGELKPSDLIVDGGVTYNVVYVHKDDVIETVYICGARIV